MSGYKHRGKQFEWCTATCSTCIQSCFCSEEVQKFFYVQVEASVGGDVRVAHQRLCCSKSDAVSALNALLAYEATPVSAQDYFCASNYLHSGHLREAAALHRQLQHILSASLPRASALPAGSSGIRALQFLQECLRGSNTSQVVLSRPKKKQIDLLCRCLLAGWPDHTARRIQSSSRIASSRATVCPSPPHDAARS
jgi:hypothetical protein